MANPKALAKIVHKLTIINAELGSVSLAAEIDAVNALVVIADAVADAIQGEVGAGTSTDIATDIADIKTVLDLL